MKTIAIIIAMIVSNYMMAQENISVTVTHIPTEKGEIMFGLYSEGTFMKAAPDYHAKSKVENKSATVVFENIPEGEYAVAVYQDENGNHRLDFEPSGRPAENYGFSNNPVLYGPPQWEDAKFSVKDEPINLEIRF
ncbi:MAG TPA: DUF2141 domain-containing protein [Salinimicrobium sp.]|nr:DUF2141 domain-containing protein [Salinimicrobium sp.]